MRPGLDGIIAEQHGIFARWQAIGCGVTPREFERLTRPGGPWVKIRYGVYTTRERWLALTSEERQLIKDRASLLVCADDAVLSHTSAARAHGLPVYDVHEDVSHVVRNTFTQSGRTQAGIKHHEPTLQPDDIVVVAGMRVTSLERTVADVAREFGFLNGLVAADSALRQGADPARLHQVAALMTDWRGAPDVSAVVMHANAGAETPIETLGRVTLLNMGIDDLELQYEIRFPTGGRAFCDIYSRRLHHVFECDGRIKYQSQLDRDGTLVTPDEVVWREKGREDKVRGQGFGFSRLTWPQVQPDNFERTSARLWQEIRQQDAARNLQRSPGA
jgi:hypothetical protein